MKTILITVGVAALILGTGLGFVLGSSSKESGHTNHSMEEQMAEMTAALSGKTGDAFDRAFLTEMIAHHEGAVHMAEMALEHAKHEEIKNMANAIISTQSVEIDQMKVWLSEWF